MEFNGKKLLILGGAAVHCKVVNAAKELGIHTIVTDYLHSSPAKLIADESWMLSITDIDAIVKKCREERVNGVLNFCIDPAQIPYLKITELLGLPCYGTKTQFLALTNKLLFKQLCKKCGVDTIPEYSYEDIEKDCAKYPVFIKPAESRGSRGQSVCYSKDEVGDAVAFAKKESANGKIVIEKYMEGKPDFSVTYFIVDGKPYLTRICDRYLGKKEYNLDRQCIAAIAPSKYSDFYVANIDPKIRRLIKELDLRNGPVFFQGFVDDDTIRFYDPGLRFPGGETELFLLKATGINLMKLMVKFALSGKIVFNNAKNDLYKFNGMKSIQLDFTCKPGRIHSLVGLEQIDANPFVKSIIKRYDAGEIVPNSGDVRQRVCEIGLLIDDNVSPKDIIEWVQSRFDVLDECGNSMLVSAFNTNEL